MRTCEEYRELISLAMDNEIAPEDMVDLQRHLLECDECRLVSDAFAAVSDCLAGEASQPPEGFAKGVMFRLGAQQELSARRKRPIWRRFAAAAACFVILAAAVSGINLNRWKNQGNSDEVPRAASADSQDADFSDDEQDSVSLFDYYSNNAEPDNDSLPAQDVPSADVPADNGAEEPMTEPEPEPVLESGTGRESSDLSGDVPFDEVNAQPESGSQAEEDMALLLSITEADIYSGEYSVSNAVPPDVSTASDDVLEALARLLSFSELADGASRFADKEPLFTIVGHISEDENIVIRIWISDDHLVIQLGEDGPVYVAAGTLLDLIELIETI